MNHAIDNSGSRKPKLASTEAFSADSTVIVTVLLCVCVSVCCRKGLPPPPNIPLVSLSLLPKYSTVLLLISTCI